MNIRPSFAGLDTAGKISPELANLIAASSNNFPPMNAVDGEGNLIGFGNDLSNAVVKAVGGNLTHLHSARWVEVLRWLDEGKADFIHDTGYTEDRDQFLDYSDPIIEMPEVIFVRTEQYDISDLDSLKGKTVACVRRHITHLYLQRFPEIGCHVVETPVQGLYELIAGKVDAFIYPKQIVLYLIQNLRMGDKAKITGGPLRTLTWSMVVKEGNHQVLRWLNEGLTRVRRSGEYDRIYNKWWGRKILSGYSKRELWVFALVTGGTSFAVALAVVLLFMIYGLRRSKRALETEVAERKRAEEALRESEETNRVLFETMAQGVVFQDADGNIISANPAAETILGLTFEQMTGRTSMDPRWRSICEDGSPFPGEIHPSMVALKTGEKVDDVVMGVFNPDMNEIRWINIHAVPRYRPGGKTPYQVYATFEDITERERAAEALRIAKENAEFANRSKTEFLANMSHELRTPLTIINGASEILTMEMFGPIDNPNYLEYAKNIREAGEHLLKLINDILNISQIEMGRFELDNEDVDVNSVIASCHQLIEGRAQEAGLTLKRETTDELPPLRGDELRLKQVALNLLSNAIKFTPEGGTVTLKTGTDDDGRVMFSVSDNGIGIAADDISRALDTFGQAEQGFSRNYQGAGIGLPLSKKLVELHGGTLELESELAVGTTVTVCFPLERVID